MWKPAPLETADIPRWDVVVESPIQVMSPGMTEEVGAPETSIDETNDLSCYMEGCAGLRNVENLQAIPERLANDGYA